MDNEKLQLSGSQETLPGPDPKDAHLRVQVEIPPGTRLHVTVEARSADGQVIAEQTLSFAPTPAESAPLRAPIFQRLWQGLRAPRRVWLAVLLVASLGVYLSVRLIRLPEFPIYFFTDEAIQTVSAADLVRDHFIGPDGEFLPIYFKNGGQFNLSLSVYAQLLPYLLFGRSIVVTRVTAVLLSSLAALAVYLTLKNVFRSRWAWSGILVLGAMPAWFLHSRTAFETTLAVAFYACFLYAYWMYRSGRDRWLYGAVVFGALSFYSYSPQQIILLATALAFFILDFRYHRQRLRLVGRAFGLALVLALPYLRFQLLHPGESLHHMLVLGSYWMDAIPFGQKIGHYFSEYLHGLSPYYWYRLDAEGLTRHIIKGYGYLWLPTLPLAALGLGLSLARLRKPEYRILLVALLLIPSGAALVEVGITRLLSTVIPYTLLTILGLTAVLDGLIAWLGRRIAPELPAALLSGLLLAALGGANIYLLTYSLQSGMTWYDNYGLSGMQYGQRQVFGEVAEIIRANPEEKILLSPTWTNGTDVLARFFFGDDPPFELGSISGYIKEYAPFDPATLFIVTPEEFEDIHSSGKFTDVQVERMLYYPNGEPGFYFLRLRYVENVVAVFAAEETERLAPKEDQVILPDGTPVDVIYTTLDMGSAQELFDGRDATIARTFEVNPMQVAVTFPAARSLESVDVLVGGVATRVTLLAYPPGAAEPLRAEVEVGATPSPRYVTLTLGQAAEVERVEIQVLNVNDDETGNVHVWEIQFH